MNEIKIPITDFVYLLPKNKFIYLPTGEVWPAASVAVAVGDTRVNDKGDVCIDGKCIVFSDGVTKWLKQYRAVMVLLDGLKRNV